MYNADFVRNRTLHCTQMYSSSHNMYILKISNVLDVYQDGCPERKGMSIKLEDFISVKLTIKHSNNYFNKPC